MKFVPPTFVVMPILENEDVSSSRSVGNRSDNGADMKRTGGRVISGEDIQSTNHEQT